MTRDNKESKAEDADTTQTQSDAAICISDDNGDGDIDSNQMCAGYILSWKERVGLSVNYNDETTTTQAVLNNPFLSVNEQVYLDNMEWTQWTATCGNELDGFETSSFVIGWYQKFSCLCI